VLPLGWLGRCALSLALTALGLPLMAPWMLVRIDRTNADQLVRVGNQMDCLDNALSRVEDDRRDRSSFQGGHDAWTPIHLCDAKVGIG